MTAMRYSFRVDHGGMDDSCLENSGRGTFIYCFLELPSPTCIAKVPEYGSFFKGHGLSRRDYDGVTCLQVPKPRGAQVGQTITVTGTIFTGITVWYVVVRRRSLVDGVMSL